MNCEGAGIVKIIDREVFMEVNSNQIYIDASLDKKNDSTYNLYLKHPNDLGAGGMRLDWDNFSKDSIISKIHYNKKTDNVIFNWLGFYNMETKKRDWSKDSSFQIEAEQLNDINLIRCKE